ncbi:hypothetical protein [Streptosporangium subroseum]|uniref:hypothetical protein n=1 Tax=Streptosporangium subroseum TaxID=106412 RepID=UPI00308C1D0D|nr:hypothetical protein OHB15_14085 [Streptosporangium subroseum]
MAGNYRLKIDQGTTIERPLRWTRDGLPVDLTGATARMEIRDKAGGTLIHRLDTENGGITLGGVTGTILLIIAAEVSSAWTARAAVYDLEVVEATGKVSRLIEGAVTISAEVTTGG